MATAAMRPLDFARVGESGSTAERIPVVCDDADVAVECARLASILGISIDPTVSASPLSVAEASVASGVPCGLATVRSPDPRELVKLARAAFASSATCAVVSFGDAREREVARAIAGDLGLAYVDELRPLLAVLALARAGASGPWTASTRGLPALDRAQIGPLRVAAGSGGGRLVRLDEGLVGWQRGTSDAPTPLGEARDVGDALRALREAAGATPPGRAIIDGVDERAVLDVLFGPPRALSDPASKSALAPYGLPLPTEELCASPSRAAAEAARIGFPVRIALASPDLRIWDHPDLAVDGVANAAAVRDVFRQVMAMASERRPDARLLGVSVSATSSSTALLAVRATPLDEGWVLAELGFADPHGVACSDRTWTVLPASAERVERALSRLSGANLVLGGGPARRRATVEALADALLRLAAFVDRHRVDVASVELRPLAVLVAGTAEIREACVTVGDHFARTLEG